MWDKILADLSAFNFGEAGRAFMTLFIAVDIVGAIPVVLSLKDKGQKISPSTVTLWSWVMLLAFLFIGEPMLNIFGVDTQSFAVAGSIVLFVLAVEMLFGVQVFKDDGPNGNANIVPLVFPLFAGAASFTALLTLVAQGVAYSNIFVAVLAVSALIFLMLKFVDPLERWLGKGGIFVLRKFFGVILLAVSIKFFIDNLMKVIDMLHAVQP
ncbi:MarC family protein [Porphyromonas endodontalis]|jgi:multiple antibiotic resistance|uniref:MarC family protein n=1 Tax=Porphyromonas endodontalis TaxID=28124 RepID=UPI0028E62253|nr:MarC family protein [Porphyromonas endodontalis]